MLLLLIKTNLCLFPYPTHTKFLYTKKTFACGGIYLVQNILLWIIFYKDDIFQQSKGCNNFVLESNLISQFEDNVISFDFRAKVLGNFEQIQICLINLLHSSRMLMHSFYILLQQSRQTRKGLYIQNYRYFIQHLLVQSSYEDIFLPALPNRLLKTWQIYYRFYMDFHEEYSLLAPKTFSLKTATTTERVHGSPNRLRQNT